MDDFYDENKCISYAELRIDGNDLDMDAISSALGLSVARYDTSFTDLAHVVGVNATTIARKDGTSCSYWQYCTEKTVTVECVHERVDDIMAVFVGKVETLRKLGGEIEDFLVTICVVVENRQKVLPGFHMTKEQIAFLASIDAEVDFDVYHWPDE